MRRIHGTFFRLVLLVLALGGTALPLAAQSRTTAAVRGTVTNQAGEPLSAAVVTLRQEETGTLKRVATNAEGRYLILQLQPGGPYTLLVQSLGYADATLEDIHLQVGDVVTLDVRLQEQAIEVEGIEVNAERAEIFNPSQVGPATRMDERVVESVPILSRNLMELAVLSPLVKTTEGGGFSVAGQNDRYNSILIDGVASKDVFGLTAGGVPGGQAGAKLIPLDAVAQYEVLVAPFDVRLSGFTGGVMNAVTKTGTNQWNARAFGAYRAEALIGDLSLPTGPVEASGVDRTLLGLSVGGPIIQDRAHFFVSGEFERRKQPPTGYNLLRDDPLLVRLSPEAVGDFSDELANQFGLETGIAGPYPLKQELANVFGRVDWTLANGQRMTVRNVFAYASNDESPNRFAFEPYGLSSNAVHRKGLNNTTSFQLFSDLGDRGANELNVSIQHSVDESTPAVTWPQMEADLVSSIDGASFQRGVRVGSQFYAQNNDLRQTNIQFTNTLSLNKDPDEGTGTGSVYTPGLTGAYYDISHRYVPGETGSYFWASMRDVRNNAPQRYERTLLADGADPTTNFSVLQWVAFLQDQIDAGKGLTMRFGLRIDVPWVLDHPDENFEFTDLFDYKTSKLPSGQFLLSPRWGFNWQSEGEHTTQVRGGLGMFVGQLPFVWLSNAFQYDGMSRMTMTCTGRVTDDLFSGNTVPPFDPFNPPGTCYAGQPNLRRTATCPTRVQTSPGPEVLGGGGSGVHFTHQWLAGLPLQPGHQPDRAPGVEPGGSGREPGTVGRLRRLRAPALRQGQWNGFRADLGLPGVWSRAAGDERERGLGLFDHGRAARAAHRQAGFQTLTPRPLVRQDEPGVHRHGGQLRPHAHALGPEPCRAHHVQLRPAPQAGAVGLRRALPGTRRQPDLAALHRPVGAALLVRLLR